MASIAQKLAYLADTKAEIAAAIVEKGGQAAAADPFRAYADKIRALPSGGGPPDPIRVYQNTRPAGWLPMPEPQGNELYILFHVPDGVSSLLAFTVTCTGHYTVALGTVADGAFVQQSVQTVTSGAAYENELFADDFGDLTGTGMKQVMVKVTGAEIQTWEPTAHEKYGSFQSWNIIEMAGRLPAATAVNCSALRSLQYFALYGPNKITSANAMFTNCGSLIAILQLDTARVTDMGRMFWNCHCLTALPAFDTSQVLGMKAMFQNCHALTEIPHFNTPQVSDVAMMFQNCYALKTVPQLDTSKVIFGFSGVFENCVSLKTVPQLNMSQALMLSGLFEGCSSLATVPDVNAPQAMDFDRVFYGCKSLTSIGRISAPVSTNFLNAFWGCDALEKVEFDKTAAWSRPPAISLENCSLGHAALVKLFESLPAISAAKALTLTGNPGAAELTDEEKAIVTGKGWTLTL